MASTDGLTPGILFSHEINVITARISIFYIRQKALDQIIKDRDVIKINVSHVWSQRNVDS